MNLRLWQAAGRKGTPKPKPAHRPNQLTRGGHRRSTLDSEQRSAKLLEFTERRQRELTSGR